MHNLQEREGVGESAHATCPFASVGRSVAPFAFSFAHCTAVFLPLRGAGRGRAAQSVQRWFVRQPNQPFRPNDTPPISPLSMNGNRDLPREIGSQSQ